MRMSAGVRPNVVFVPYREKDTTARGALPGFIHTFPLPCRFMGLGEGPNDKRRKRNKRGNESEDDRIDLEPARAPAAPLKRRV